MTAELVFGERPAAGAAAGLLVLHHGRGADERDLLPLADAIDPDRRLHVVTPGGPLSVAGWGGRHWYRVPRVGYPDAETFWASVESLAAFHDGLWERLGVGPERTVLGGFSMGAVMSYALGLNAGRPAVAGVLGLSGFLPVVEGWAPSLADRTQTRVWAAHGRADPVIPFDFFERAVAVLGGSPGVALEAHPFDGGHEVALSQVRPIGRWLAETLS